MGYMQVQSRIGAALAPWITKWLIAFHHFLPFLIMGGASFVASILLAWLPETRDAKTAETLDLVDHPEPRSNESDLPLIDQRTAK